MGGLAKKLLGTGKREKLYVDDVFSTYLYTGNASTQTINNGIDLAGEGGLVWIKPRTSNPNTNNHQLVHQSNGDYLSSNNSAAITGYLNYVDQFRSDGFRVNTNAWAGVNYVSWTFRRAPKFFDVVTYTGDGTNQRQIPHALGVRPGFIALKRIDSGSNWWCWARASDDSTIMHHSDPNQGLILNSTNAGLPGYSAAARGGDDYFQPTWNLGVAANQPGAQYVAYLWAHDPSEDGIIQCGSWLGNAATQDIALGWEPQYILWKQNNGGQWHIFDTTRGLDQTVNAATLYANLSNAEVPFGAGSLIPTATGFKVNNSAPYINGSGTTYIYLAIRRPNKPPKSGTQVYNAVTWTGTSSTKEVLGAGFAPDFGISHIKSGASSYGHFFDRLRNATNRLAGSLGGEITGSELLNNFTMDGFVWGSGPSNGGNTSPYPYVAWLFKRSPKFLDVVSYTGDGVAGKSVRHSLKATPELWLIRTRMASLNVADVYAGLVVGSTAISPEQYLFVGRDNAAMSEQMTWSSQYPTEESIILGSSKYVNEASSTFIAYLFASLPGISKVGSYVGNGGSQTIDCGFTTGARFILIKRTDSPGDWYVWDTARGIIAANDPHLSLNTAATEVTTDDSVDPDASGFIVNQNTATNINMSGAHYIFLAIA